MKQQQANIIEAKAAIRRADESVIQGRSIVIFTVVTIIFVSVSQSTAHVSFAELAKLPLQFMTSVFGMNAREFSEDGVMHLEPQLKWMCK
jgi:hypothetical protein